MRRREIERQQLEEKRRREEEKRKREEELKQQQAEEERIRKEEERVAEQQRRQQEALQRLQEQQALAQAQARVAQQGIMQQQQQQQQQPVAKAPTVTVAPWAQHVQQQPDNNDALSMAEIQKIQEEREMKERAIAQAQKMEQAARAAALLQQQQQAAIKLRWAKQNVSTAAKSLAEIQAEEAAQLARQKEKERQEKASQQVNLNLAAAGAWGASHNNSAWNSGRTAAAVVGQPSSAPATSSSANNPNAGWKAGSVGFWEEPATVKAQPAAAKVQPSPKVQNSAKAQTTASVNKPAVAKAAASSAAATAKKNRSNKEEETVRKLFVQTTEKKDNFSQWCFEYLKKVQAPIDVPTFVSFLKVSTVLFL